MKSRAVFSDLVRATHQQEHKPSNSPKKTEDPDPEPEDKGHDSIARRAAGRFVGTVPAGFFDPRAFCLVATAAFALFRGQSLGLLRECTTEPQT